MDTAASKLTVTGVAGDDDEEEEGVVEILFLAGNSLSEYVDGDGDGEVPDFVLRSRRSIFEGGRRDDD